MKKNKKLVIKVNYDGSDKPLTDEPVNLEMTQEWNIKRIVITLLLLFVIVTGWYYVFIKLSSPIINAPALNSITHVPQKETKLQITDPQERGQEVISESVTSEKSKLEKGDKKVFSAIDKKTKNNIVIVNPIYSKQVVRSLLTNKVINNEPIDLISSPILVEKDNVRRLYYFTELKDMSGKTIYHNWIYKGKSVFRKKVNINGNRWRVTTQKKLDNTLLGDWKVILTDSNDQLLHEIKFEVIE